HIRCSIDDAAEYAILPGDPGRVDRIRTFLENTREVACNREFKTATGYYKGIKVMVTSTGIGGPSTCIAVEELRKIGVKTMIRVGSCGALQKDIKLGDIIIASGAVRDEGTSDTYIGKGYPAVPDTEVMTNLLKSAEELEYKYHSGIIRSHDSFYTDDEEEIDDFWSEKGVLGADMESSPLFVIGGLRGIKTASVLNVVVEYNKELDNGINAYVDGENESMIGENHEILTVLESIVRLNGKKR
ncbi:MAG: hypothetical protein K0R09_361, partial [Clostridiales bacterium]|nr:hypothetical protein [Clostridiales bacterium]